MHSFIHASPSQKYILVFPQSSNLTSEFSAIYNLFPVFPSASSAEMILMVLNMHISLVPPARPLLAALSSSIADFLIEL